MQSMQNIQYEYLDERYQELTILGNEEKQSVYLAKDTVSDQIVVKKYIEHSLTELYERLHEIQNPHFAQVYHVARGAERTLVILEYISGKTVEEYQKEISVFSEEETICYMTQLLEGLAVLHGMGIIHRDINPKNVLISTDNTVKLLDFDIGRKYQTAKSSDTVIMGTVGYAAPEQFGFSQSDARTDLYAVGVLMNEMLTGKIPREGLYKTGRLSTVIETCIQMAPENRYQSAEELLAEISNPGKKKSLPDRAGTAVKEKSIIPGFRTGVWWKKLAASFWYVIMTVSGVVSVAECAKTPEAAILEFVAMNLCVWISVFVSLDFLHWMEKMPGVRNLKRAGKRRLGVVLWIVLFYGGAILDQYVRMCLLRQ